MKKITVIGDVMVEPPFFQEISQTGNYDFSMSFVPLGKLLGKADYAIANLETPLAGEAAGYTATMVSFNAPDTLAQTLKDIGIDMVSTANNHCLDRGYEGLAQTIDTLDRIGLAHSGTFKRDHTGSRVHYFTLGGVRIAVLAYTYGTNYGNNHVLLEGEDVRCVNLLRPINAKSRCTPAPQSFRDTKAYCESLLCRRLDWEEANRLKLAMGLSTVVTDSVVDEQEQDAYLRLVEADYREARANADLVLFCPHTGGQFNTEPAAYSVRMLEKAAAFGFDAILAAHSHTTQKYAMLGHCVTFYSLGNVSMTPGTFYSNPACLPQYGLAVHLYVDEAAKKLDHTAYSIFKMVPGTDGPMRIVPVDALNAELTDREEKQALAAEVGAICTRVSGRSPCAPLVREEYEL